jgi:predicted DNA-binding transcriptional regulator AlpA
MTHKTTKTRTKPTADALGYRRALTEAFPCAGKVRVPQIAANLGIGQSTWWLYVKEERVLPPVKYGARVSVWDAEYIRQLADSGIPTKAAAAA